MNVRKVRGCFGINNSVLSVSILGTLILKINNVRTALKTKFSGSSPASVNTVPTKSPISTDNTVTPAPIISTGTNSQNRAKIADKTKYIPNNFNLAFAPQINIKTSLGFALLVSYLDMSIMKLWLVCRVQMVWSLIKWLKSVSVPRRHPTWQKVDCVLNASFPIFSITNFNYAISALKIKSMTSVSINASHVLYSLQSLTVPNVFPVPKTSTSTKCSTYVNLVFQTKYSIRSLKSASVLERVTGTGKYVLSVSILNTTIQSLQSAWYVPWIRFMIFGAKSV